MTDPLQVAKQNARNTRARNALGMATAILAVRKDGEPLAEEIINQAQDRATDPDMLDTEYKDDDSNGYIGKSLAGVASADQVLVDITNAGGSDIRRFFSAALFVLGKTGALLLPADVHGLDGQSIKITRNYGEPIFIPVEECLNFPHTGASLTAGVEQTSPTKRYTVSKEKPLAILMKGDKLKVELVGANGAAVVAGHKIRVVLYGDKLRIN